MPLMTHAAQRASHPGVLAIRADGVFDGTRHRRGRGAMILVEDGRVRDVDVSGAAPPENALVADMQGTTVVPGWIDTHVHLGLAADDDPVARMCRETDDELFSTMLSSAEQTLRGGVTTLRDLGDRDFAAVELGRRAEWTDDLPTIVASGPPITTPGGHCHFMGGALEPTDGALETEVQKRASRGASVIKVMVTGGDLTPGTRTDEAQFSLDHLRTVVHESHSLGLPVAAHAHGTVGIHYSLEAGFDGIEHCSFLGQNGIEHDPVLIERLAKSGVFVCPTWGCVPSQPRPSCLARDQELVAQNVAAMIRAGVRVVAGTDAGVDRSKPHGCLPHAIAELVAIGMPNDAALAAATAVAATACGVDGRKGRIARGMDADLLCLAGDPFHDIAAVHRPVALFKRGAPVEIQTTAPGTQ